MEETKIVELKSPKYLFYARLIESKNYKFQAHERPYDVYSDGKNEIRICEGCRILSINGKRVQGLILWHLINYLFNNNEFRPRY